MYWIPGRASYLTSFISSTPPKFAESSLGRVTSERRPAVGADEFLSRYCDLALASWIWQVRWGLCVLPVAGKVIGDATVVEFAVLCQYFRKELQSAPKTPSASDAAS